MIEIRLHVNPDGAGQALATFNSESLAVLTYNPKHTSTTPNILPRHTGFLTAGQALLLSTALDILTVISYEWLERGTAGPLSPEVAARISVHTSTINDSLTPPEEGMKA